jgi:hypothetical protein
VRNIVSDVAILRMPVQLNRNLSIVGCVSTVDLKTIMNSHGRFLSDAKEIVGEFEFTIAHPTDDDEPVIFKIKVKRNSKGEYIGIF